MKTINFELSKRLNEEGLLDNIETEFYYWIGKEKSMPILRNISDKGFEYLKHKGDIKTLTLEEAIEFLPSFYKLGKIGEEKEILRLTGNKEDKYMIGYGDLFFYGNSMLESIEKLIIHLLDKNLITKK